MTLAEILNAERERQWLSYNALADRCDLYPSRVRGVMLGDPKDPQLSTVRRILKGMGLSLAWLESQLPPVPDEPKKVQKPAKSRRRKPAAE